MRDPRIILPTSLHYGSYDSLAQHPLLDDNGDGVPSYILGNGDGVQVASLTLGEGIKVNALGNPADIATVAPSISLPMSTSTTQLWLKANTNSRVARAWAEISRPGSLTTGGGSGQVIPTFDIIPLIYDGNGWAGDYNKFDTAGTYNIHYYTKDIQTGDISPAVSSTVYKQLANNTPPMAFSLISPNDEASPAPIFPLTWQESSSRNSLTYTLLVATDSTFNTIVYREESIPQAVTYISGTVLKDPASTTGGYYCQNGDSYCFWKVQAIDKYGSITESNTRSFTIVSTNGLPGIIKGNLTNSTTGAPIAGGTVTVGSQNFTTLSNGAFIFVTSTGSYNMTASATGYQQKVLPVIATAGAIRDGSMALATGTIKPGDCSGDGVVTIAEVQSAINMFLGLTAPLTCIDVDNSGAVSISEVQKVINSFLGL